MTQTETTSLASMALALASAKNSDGEYILGEKTRVDCDQPPFSNTLIVPHQFKGKDCQKCDGRGWNPLDPMLLGRWMAAIEKGNMIDLDSDPVNGWRCKIQTRSSESRHTADSPELAFFQSAMKALGLDPGVADE